jgi:hypothetical protein
MVLAQKQTWRHEDIRMEDKDTNHTAMPTWDLTEVSKTYDWEMTASSTNVRKTGFLPAENWNKIHVSHLVQVITENGLELYYNT